MSKLVYRHTQVGWVIIGSSVGIFIAIVLLSLAMPPNPGQIPLLAFTTVFLALITWIFGTLTVTVDNQWITVAFGPGFVTKRIPINSVTGCEVVRNKWWWGWGVRLIPGGLLFNVSGLHAVELQLISGSRIRIGTDEPEKLAFEIRNRLLTGAGQSTLDWA